MKKVLFAAVAVFAFGVSNAQEVKFGAKVGANLATVKTTTPNVDGEAVTLPLDNKMLFGFHFGGFAEIGFSEKFSFQPELLVSLQGSKFEASETETFGPNTYSYSIDQKLKTTYINVPLLAKYYATEKFFINAGPQVGFLLSAKQDYTQTETDNFSGSTTTETTTTEGIDVKDSFKSIDFSLAAGAGYYFTENIFAEVRYTFGLSNVAEKVSYNDGFTSFEYEPTAKNNVLQISVGYRF